MDRSRVALCVFDERRGGEGREEDRLLAFAAGPAPGGSGVPLEARVAMVGLAMGMQAFFGGFGADGDALQRGAAFRQVCVRSDDEPCVWWLLSVPHAVAPPASSADSALFALARRAMSLFRLAHRSVQALVDAADAGAGAAAFAPLERFVAAWVRAQCRRRCAALAAATHPLACSAVGIHAPAPLEPAGALLASSMLGCLESLCGDAAVRRGALLFRGRVLASSVAAEDLAPLAELLRNAGVCEEEEAAGAGATRGGAGFFFGSGEHSGVREADAAAPAELSATPWRVDRDGVVRVVGSDGVAAAPRVYLSGDAEPSEVLALRSDGILVVLVLREGVSAAPLCRTVLDAAVPRCGALARAASAAIAANHGGHVPGYRFAAFDTASRQAAGTPATKLRTLSARSVATMATLRGAADDAVLRGECAGRQLPLELWSSSSNDACAFSRVAAGGAQQLHCCVEGAPPDLGKLPAAMGAHCVGELLKCDY